MQCISSMRNIDNNCIYGCAVCFATLASLASLSYRFIRFSHIYCHESTTSKNKGGAQINDVLLLFIIISRILLLISTMINVWQKKKKHNESHE